MVPAGEPARAEAWLQFARRSVTQDIALSRGVFWQIVRRSLCLGGLRLGWEFLGQGVSRGETWNVSERLGPHLGRPGFCDLRQNRPGGGGKILERIHSELSSLRPLPESLGVQSSQPPEHVGSTG